jgi:hypothetical protein
MDPLDRPDAPLIEKAIISTSWIFSCAVLELWSRLCREISLRQGLLASGGFNKVYASPYVHR